MSQALYRKWRPHQWNEVVGQEHVVQTLQNAVRSGRVGHAYLLAGPRGTGKTTTARLLAKAVNCLDENLEKRPCDACDHCKAVNDGRFLDLIEIDAASNTSVDDVRDLRDKINFAPSQGRFKVYIIDEVHMLSTAAFNALLKTLEEPPPHAIFILATTEVHKIPATVLSRCQRHEFRRIPVKEIHDRLKELCHQEGLDVDDDALMLIARQATGSLRDAISLLDQLSSTGQRITLADAQIVLGTATQAAVIEMVNAILTQDSAAGINGIHTALDSGTDPRQYARQVVDYLRNVLLMKMGTGSQLEATQEMRGQMSQHARSFETPQLLEDIRLFNSAASDLRGAWQPGLLLELALAEAVTPQGGSIQASPAPVQAPTTQNVQPPPAANSLVPETSHSSPPPGKPVSPPAPLAARTAPTQLKPAAESPAVPADQSVGLSGLKPGIPSLQDVSQAWNKIKNAIKAKRSQTTALLNSAKLVAVKDGVLVLGFQSELLKSKMESEDNLIVTRQGLASVMGVDMPIHVIVLTTKSGGSTNDLDIDQDSMVGTALNLGGQVVHKE